jgi:hypothetical protein
VRGSVVDARGNADRGADVLVTESSWGSQGIEFVVAKTHADGTFLLRSLGRRSWSERGRPARTSELVYVDSAQRAPEERPHAPRAPGSAGAIRGRVVVDREARRWPTPCVVGWSQEPQS